MPLASIEAIPNCDAGDANRCHIDLVHDGSQHEAYI